MDSIVDQLNSDLEKVKALERIMIARATGAVDQNNGDYELLRSELIASPKLKDLLPDFVRTCRSLDVFWSYIKSRSSGSGSYSERTKIISMAFTPVMDELEGTHVSPGDSVVSNQLTSFDREGVHTIWMKALDRRQSDPEAFSFGKTVCPRPSSSSLRPPSCIWTYLVSPIEVRCAGGGWQFPSPMLEPYINLGM
jgi:hypothetical protein